MTENDNATKTASADINLSEAVGAPILGFLFFIVLMSLLRSLKRERKLLENIADLRETLGKQHSGE